MDLTPEILRAAYAYLAETPPFNEWNLPDSEDVEFLIVPGKDFHGICRRYDVKEGDKVVGLAFTIGVSARTHKHTATLMSTMAHEMVHVHEYQARLRTTSVRHGAVFRALAASVCEAHGFDPGHF